MAHKKVDEKLTKAVIDYLKEPKSSQGKAAKKFGIGIGTVNRIVAASAEKPPLERSKTKNASLARAEYGRERRRELLDKFLGKINTMLDSQELKPGGMQALAIALGTAIDKYRLEEGSSGQGKAALLVLMEEIKKNAEAARASSTTK